MVEQKSVHYFVTDEDLRCVMLELNGKINKKMGKKECQQASAYLKV